jgi:hypothetical protein
MTDADNLGLVVEHASGVKPGGTIVKGDQMLPTVTALVPPWGADTHDGYDIYAGNWPCDPAVIPATPIGVHKASEGLGTYDAKFGEWVRTVATRHRYRGAYHVIWPWRAGKSADYIERQADAYIDFTAQQGVDWSQPGWFVQIDNEQFSGMPRIANVDEVRRFADRCIARIGKKVSHYCNPVTDPTLFFAAELADLAKWEAQYNRNPSRAATVIRQWGGWVVNGIWNGRPVDANFIEKPDELDRVAGYGLTEDDLTPEQAQMLSAVYDALLGVGPSLDPNGQAMDRRYTQHYTYTIAQDITNQVKALEAKVDALGSGGGGLTEADVKAIINSTVLKTG